MPVSLRLVNFLTFMVSRELLKEHYIKLTDSEKACVVVQCLKIFQNNQVALAKVFLL